MNANNKWQDFMRTGAVSSYLNYCNALKNPEVQKYEVIDRRIDNQRKQYR
ncbi:MAG: hypothetical protein RR177_00180 [Oscillospiraceae bacterium]